MWWCAVMCCVVMWCGVRSHIQTHSHTFTHTFTDIHTHMIFHCFRCLAASQLRRAGSNQSQGQPLEVSQKQPRLAGASCLASQPGSQLAVCTAETFRGKVKKLKQIKKQKRKHRVLSMFSCFV